MFSNWLIGYDRGHPSPRAQDILMLRHKYGEHCSIDKIERKYTYVFSLLIFLVYDVS